MDLQPIGAALPSAWTPTVPATPTQPIHDDGPAVRVDLGRDSLSGPVNDVVVASLPTRGGPLDPAEVAHMQQELAAYRRVAAQAGALGNATLGSAVLGRV